MKALAFVLGFSISLLFGAIDRTIYLMPMNCAELVPDSGPFLSFFESVARGLAVNNKIMARRLFRVLAMRDKLASETGRVGDANPVDPLIRRFLCYYREQRNPTALVSYDDGQFLAFVKKELIALEKNVDLAVYAVAVEEHNRKEFERRMRAQQNLVETLKQEADEEAALVFERAAKQAKAARP